MLDLDSGLVFLQGSDEIKLWQRKGSILKDCTVWRRVGKCFRSCPGSHRLWFWCLEAEGALIAVREAHLSVPFSCLVTNAIWH